MAPAAKFVAEAIRADDRIRLQANSVFKQATRQHSNSRHQPTVVAHLYVAANENRRFKMTAFTNSRAALDDAEGSNGGRGGNLSRRCNQRRRMDARSRLRPKHRFNKGAQ